MPKTLTERAAEIAEAPWSYASADITALIQELTQTLARARAPDIGRDDCAFCRECDSERKTRVAQTEVFVYRGYPTVWRERECMSCGSRYKTMEIPLPKDATGAYRG